MKENKLSKFRQIWDYYRGWKWLLFIGLSISLLISSYLVILAKTTNVEILQQSLQTKTTIYSANDEYVGTLQNQKGTYVSLDAISDTMIETVIATEDKRFYQHTGFDTVGLGRAMLRLIINRDTSGGGGSTLTQQLAKNSFLTLDQTLQRKFKELFLALELEKTYSKDQLLEMYLNHSYFGNGVWGVEDAAQKYFGHSASLLDWNESAVLTGMLKGPSLYNPIDDYEAAINRRNTVLEVIEKSGIIDKNTQLILNETPIYLSDNYHYQDDYRYPFYFDAVINEAIEATNIPEVDLIGKGYKIYTHLDPNYQDALDNAYENDWMFPEEISDETLVQSASIVLNPETGGVVAVYGGRGDYVYRGFNRGTDMRRAPGSTIKPLGIYVPALENGYNIHSQVPDIVTSYGAEAYTPQNYDLQTDPSGEVELYYALAQSKNTSAVYLLDKLGISKSVHKLQQFGLSIPSKDQSLTLALGALETGVTLEELANAYSAFANEGIRVESSFIRQIEDANGKVVYQNNKPRKHMVMTAKIASDMTSMMLDTYGGLGTGYGAGPDIGLLAGKTGSTEVFEGSSETRDRWMVGYTPDFVLVSWSGLDEVGDVSLDELMPSGMGVLFKQISTNLMYASPQTPFKEIPASQMEEDSNLMENIPWRDETAETLDKWFDIIESHGSSWLEQAEKLGQEIGNSIKSWWEQIN